MNAGAESDSPREPEPEVPAGPTTSAESAEKSSAEQLEVARLNQDTAPGHGPAATSKDCDNCGTPLQGRYCHGCGQEARSLDISFRVFAGEWLATVLGFDGRVWRTLGKLVLKPGELSIDFLEGRRSRYVSPLRLYFFVSVAVFLSLALSGSSVVHTTERQKSEDGSTIAYSWKGNQKKTNSEDSKPNEAPAAGPSRETGDTEQELEDPSPASDDSGEFENTLKEAAEKLANDPSAINDAFMERIPHAFFFLVPLYALFLKIVFRKRYRSYVQHLVVSLHLHTLGFVLIGIGTVVDYLLGFRGDDAGPAGAFAILVLLIHTFSGFRKIYGDRRRTLAWKFSLLCTAHLISFIVVLMITLAATFLML